MWTVRGDPKEVGSSGASRCVRAEIREQGHTSHRAVRGGSSRKSPVRCHDGHAQQVRKAFRTCPSTRRPGKRRYGTCTRTRSRSAPPARASTRTGGLTWSPSWNAPSPTRAAGSGWTTPLPSERREGPPSPSARPTRPIPSVGSPRPTSGNGCTRSTVRAPRPSSSPSPMAAAPYGTSNGSPRASTSCRTWPASSSPATGTRSPATPTSPSARARTARWTSGRPTGATPR